MDKEYIEKIQQGLQTAFIDSTFTSNLAYKPEFLSNNYKEGKKVMSTIEEELQRCDEFCISVAFVTMGGLTPFLQILKELEERGIRGKFLTTDYLHFNQPEALEKLASLKNIQLKIYQTDGYDEGFHTKGYIFKQEEIYRIIIGSSNMTASALTKNKEWNTKFISTNQGELAKQVVEEFNDFWNAELARDYSDYIEQYKTKYEIIKKQKKIAKQNEIVSIKQYKLQPNKMQTAFINNLRKIREEGEDRALLISATGERDIFMTDAGNLGNIRVSAA